MRTANHATMNRYSQEGKRVQEQLRECRVGEASQLTFARGGLRAAIIGALACLLMAISASMASAAAWGTHETYGEGRLNIPVGVAVNQASGDVYVGNYECYNPCPKVSTFDRFGGHLSPPSPFGPEYGSGVAVNPTNNDIFAVNAEFHAVGVYEPNGAQVASATISLPSSGNVNVGFGPETVVQIASDQVGNVYVPVAPENKIEVFSANGSSTPAAGVLHEIKGPAGHELRSPEGVAIGPNGNVWVADTGDNRIEEFEPTGTFVDEITEDAEGVQAVAVDGSGDVFASIGGAKPHVVEYAPPATPSGTYSAIAGAEHIAEGILSESGPESEANPGLHALNGIAFDRGREYLYVVNGGGNVLLQFSDWQVVTGAPNNVGHESATVLGTIEVGAGASVATCKFEYGPTATYGSSAPCKPEGPYSASTPVSAKISSLAPGVEYHYRISATSPGGATKVGRDRTFGPPVVVGQSIEASVTTARARATVSPNSEPTHCEVQYVEEAEYAVSGYAHADAVPCSSEVGPEAAEYPVEAHLGGLAKNTTYRYRFVATDGSGETVGSGQTFATFGIVPESFMFGALGEAGEEVTQAGAHSYAWTDTFRLNGSTHMFSNGATDPLSPDANAKNVITELPPGLIGNPNATTTCSAYEVVHQDCGGAAQVGVLNLYTANPSAAEEGRLSPHEAALYNVVPPKGVAAQFAASIAKLGDVRIDARVRTASDYGVTAEVLNSTADEGLVEAEVTLWGVPAAASHDEQRRCGGSAASCSEHGAILPFLTNPTSCTGPREARMTVEPWQEDEPPVVVGASAKMPPITGCHEVPFTAAIKVTPESSVSDSPTGLHVTLTVPQQENPNKIAEADLKDAEVKLPAGMTVNPSSANGLAGCPLLTGKEAKQEAEEAEGTISGINLETKYAANCPNASKVGKVTIKTPLLEEELKGGVYVARQNANPFKSLLAIYIAAEAPERGVVVKLAGHVEPNPVTGQLTTTFDENPQLPFETLNLEFFGGERAALATPSKCGTYTATTVLEPWSHMEANGTPTGTPDATPSSEFAINSRCANAFAPSLTAGTTSNEASSFSPFVMNLTRKDGEQTFKTVAMTLPAGISGMISHVTPCAEAQANAGTCPASSKIGHVVTEAGVGGEPVTLPEAGKPEDPVFLSEKYDGAPFGLSIVVPAEAGPFNLGTVVVRARVEVNPSTAQVSVITDASGPHAMPTILDGIPVDIKAIHVEINRPDFMFNPTSCEPKGVAGTIGSQEGASANVASHFQAAGCAALPFKPKFSALIHAHHTRKDGEYLHVVVKSAFGQANIGRVHVQLPGKLPSRLETLKHACTEAQFAANPAGCPAESFVGRAIAHTPILPVPMRGPAVFVSHAGRGFPNLDLLLQGDGVHITLVGDTHINGDITTSTFKTVPDVPVSRFDLVLPAGPDSALAGNGNMCARHLYMPTTLTGQNGAVLKQRTKIMVTGCKPELHVVKTRRHGAKAKVVVQVPSAGRLVANGAGIGRDVKKTGKAKRVTLTVRLKRHVRRMLREHHHRRLKVTVHLRFHPRHGKQIKGHVSVLMR